MMLEAAGERALRARRAFFTPLTRLLNPFIRRVAGRSGTPLIGLLSHTGRRTGRTYTTPVGVGSTGSALFIPLTFGSDSDWCRNVLAAGGCTVRWRGREYTTDQPELVEEASVEVELHAAFSGFVRLQLRAMGTHEFLRLSVAETAPASY